MIDLHTHTNISDGALTPKELIQLAKTTGLSAVAITDHDSIDGLDEAQQEADRLNVKLIKGIEFSTEFGDHRILHILGLNIDIQNEEFIKTYSTYRKIRAEKLENVFKRLNSAGIKIDNRSAEQFMSGNYIDRQAIAKCMVAKGYTQNIKESWRKYLDKINYTEGELIKPADAFKAIHAAGGKACLAHFHLRIGFKDYPEKEIHTHLKQLKEMGLDGMEYYYPSFSDEDIKRCAMYIKEFDFEISGGTDFHGANRPHIKLGIGEGNFNVPDSILEKILDKNNKSL